jgi:hypothetical protein
MKVKSAFRRRIHLLQCSLIKEQNEFGVNLGN